jgi:nicotinate-nucleotide adenylyltransferase
MIFTRRSLSYTRRVERIGILGGTFDPVHVGHLAAACAARHQLALERVLLVVARDPWQKQHRAVAPAEARYEMVVAAVEDVDGLEPSRIELDRPGPTYTIDTVEQLRRPDRELFLVVGADVASNLHTWERVDDLRTAVTLALVDREHAAPTVVPAGWHAVHVAMPRLDVSSTDLRRRVAEGVPVEFLVPLPAVRVLRARGLYTAR